MTVVAVSSMGEALAIMQRIQAELSDGSELWPLIEDRLPELQKIHWDGFKPHFRRSETYERRAEALGLHAAAKRTQSARSRRRARRKRKDYYHRNPPGKRASPARPRFEWTGNLRRSTERLVRKSSGAAWLDPDVAYRGPLRKDYPSTPFSSVFGGPRAWDPRSLDVAADGAVKERIRRSIRTQLRRRGS